VKKLALTLGVSAGAVAALGGLLFAAIRTNQKVDDLWTDINNDLDNAFERLENLERRKFCDRP
jgi:outer membrane murein-binding lipoprotein Lpp